MRVAIFLLLAIAAWPQAFLQKPYLQLGNNPANENPESLSLLWHASDSNQPWTVEWRPEGSAEWRAAPVQMLRRIVVRGITPHRVYEAALKGLLPGKEFVYRVLLSGREVFFATSRAPRSPGEDHAFVVVGDTAQGSRGQKELATQMFKMKPEYLVIMGDIVYSRGLISQYYDRYFPIYNCDVPADGACAPILRSIPTMATPGNHDIDVRVDLGSQPGALAFFYYWSQPLNGPITDRNSPEVPRLSGSDEVRSAFYERAENFPQMTMFSFDYGDVHWTLLDSNAYIDWRNAKLREWVRQDLRKAKGAKWRFVGQHHPAFSSARKHFGAQWMRQLFDIFEEEGVDLVFAGHVHNYQRTYPMRRRVKPLPADSDFDERQWVIDKAFDGTSKTKPDGIISIVTGGGGASLKGGSQDGKPTTWQPFTARYYSAEHSFTLVEVSPKSVLVRQIGQEGREIDRFRVTR